MRSIIRTFFTALVVIVVLFTSVNSYATTLSVRQEPPQKRHTSLNQLLDNNSKEQLKKRAEDRIKPNDKSKAEEKPVEKEEYPPVEPLRDSAGNLIKDQWGLIYKLDSLGFILTDDNGDFVIDSLLSYTKEQMEIFAWLTSLNLPHIDTLRIPPKDSLGNIIRDTLGVFYVLDSNGLIAQDSAGWFIIDSMKSYTERQRAKFARQEKRALQKIADSIYHSTPRMWESYAIDHKMQTEMIIAWNNDTYFNKINRIDVDTLINDNFHDYNWLKNDVGATTLGISGSPTLLHNWFKRKSINRASYWDVLAEEAYTKETIPYYNTKSPYTVLAYYGTLFANKEKEETNVRVIHTQNITPEMNFAFFYQRKGANGMLENEDDDTRTLSLTTNYMGKKYAMNAGYIFNRVKRSENGGISDDWWLTDTIIEARAIGINLKEASSISKNNTLFLTQSYGIPISFLKKDTTDIGGGTEVYFGHSSEFNVYSRSYTDNIQDTIGANFYNNRFFINPTASYDSLRTLIIDNRVFIRLQPWSKYAIVSKLEGGLGYEILKNYTFRPEFFVKPVKNRQDNNTYFYAGASGTLKRYFAWEAMTRYDITGYYQSDVLIDGKIRFSAYPIKDGIHLTGRFYMKNYTPDLFYNYYYSNHHIWDNDFSKINDTRVEATFTIPHWNFELGFSYGLLSDHIYYGLDAQPIQNSGSVSIMAATLSKSFKVAIFRFDNRILWEHTSDKESLPLPQLSANLRYYLDFTLVKNVLDVQLGADLTYYTKYYAPKYDPSIAAFHTQNEKEIGENPYIDLFLNMKWKRATIFVKYVNAAQDWPESNYFSAPHYIRPQKAIKLGMTWPFHVKPQKKNNLFEDNHHGGGGMNNHSH